MQRVLLVLDALDNPQNQVGIPQSGDYFCGIQLKESLFERRRWVGKRPSLIHPNLASYSLGELSRPIADIQDRILDVVAETISS